MTLFERLTMPHWLVGCIMESTVIDDARGRTCRFSCRCGKIESEITFPPIKGGYPAKP